MQTVDNHLHRTSPIPEAWRRSGDAGVAPSVIFTRLGRKPGLSSSDRVDLRQRFGDVHTLELLA